jgi:hypothetical protein
VAWTQADVDKLKASIASGRKSVTYEGKGAIVYQDTSAQLAALAKMEAEVNTATGAVRTRQVRFVTRSGF